MAKMDVLKRLPMILPPLTLEAAWGTTKVHGRNIFPVSVAMMRMMVCQSLVCRRKLKECVSWAAKMAKTPRDLIRTQQ
jgi:hypothetical protein